MIFGSDTPAQRYSSSDEKSDLRRPHRRISSVSGGRRLLFGGRWESELRRPKPSSADASSPRSSASAPPPTSGRDTPAATALAAATFLSIYQTIRQRLRSDQLEV